MTLVEIIAFSALMWLIVAATISLFHGAVPLVDSIGVTLLCCFALSVIGPLLGRLFALLSGKQRERVFEFCLRHFSKHTYKVIFGVVIYSSLAWIIVLINFQILFNHPPPIASFLFVFFCVCIYAVALIPIIKLFGRIKAEDELKGTGIK